MFYEDDDDDDANTIKVEYGLTHITRKTGFGVFESSRVAARSQLSAF